MAEYGAHITITSRNRPSIFDVVAQDSLMSTLQPAIRHSLKVAAESNPSRYGWCYRYHNELFFLFNLIIQNHYLSNYGGSFSENFYDLKRVQTKTRFTKEQEPLSLTEETRVKSLIALVGVPYLQSNLDNLYHNIQEKDADGLLPQEEWKTSIQRAFLKLWPLLHFTWEGLNLIFYIRYLIGKSKYHSPLLPLCGVKLSSLTEADYEVMDEVAQRMLSFRNIRNLQQLGQWIMERVGSSIMNSLEVTAFFLQFLDWFYSSGNTPRSVLSKQIPPAPHEVSHSMKSNLKTGDCPLCCKQRKQDTALSVSGYVFCYGCILPYVKNERKCPVTGYPASTSQLIRIYLDA